MYKFTRLELEAGRSARKEDRSLLPVATKIITRNWLCGCSFLTLEQLTDFIFMGLTFLTYEIRRLLFLFLSNFLRNSKSKKKSPFSTLVLQMCFWLATGKIGRRGARLCPSTLALDGGRELLTRNSRLALSSTLVPHLEASSRLFLSWFSQFLSPGTSNLGMAQCQL